MRQFHLAKIEMIPLTAANCHLVVGWRNHEKNRLAHSNSELISLEQQQDWFAKQPIEINQYWLFKCDDAWLGMTHLSEINRYEKTAHIGILMNPVFFGCGLSFSLSYLTLKYAFEQEGFNLLFAKLKKDNMEAYRYNQILGFEFLRTHHDPHFELFQLKKANYYNSLEDWLPLIN
jgi:RimJ/RimL family protein N-acetyltransferase